MAVLGSRSPKEVRGGHIQRWSKLSVGLTVDVNSYDAHVHDYDDADKWDAGGDGWLIYQRD